MMETLKRAERKVYIGIIPFLVLRSLAAYIDQVKAEFAKLRILDTLHMRDLIFVVGVGLFFLAYSVCEVSSNIIPQRIGAWLWLACIF